MKRIVIIIALVLRTMSLFGQDDTRTLDDYFDGFVEVGVSPMQSRWKSGNPEWIDEPEVYHNTDYLAYYHIGLIFNPTDWAFIGGDIKTYFYDETGTIEYNALDSDFHIQAGFHYSFFEIGVNYYNWSSNRYLINNVDSIMSLEEEFKELYIAFIIPENRYINGSLHIGVSPLNIEHFCLVPDNYNTDYIFNTSMEMIVTPYSWLYGKGQVTSYFLDQKEQLSFNPLIIDFLFEVGITHNNFTVGFRHYCSHPINAEYYFATYRYNRTYEEIFIQYSF